MIISREELLKLGADLFVALSFSLVPVVSGFVAPDVDPVTRARELQEIIPLYYSADI